MGGMLVAQLNTFRWFLSMLRNFPYSLYGLFQPPVTNWWKVSDISKAELYIICLYLI